MLTPADDLPLHQTPEPMAYAGSDRNFYDRYFFNGYDAAGNVFFAAALGLYPQLNIMDASFCIIVDGVQHNLRASKEMHGDRLALTVGPINLSIDAPFEKISLHIDENEFGLSGDIQALARYRPIEEPRFTRRQGTRLLMDVTRATQNITWQGALLVNGTRINVDGFWGTRDRSWGLRPVGSADPQSPLPAAAPQFYWLWTPINFDNICLFAHSNDDATGTAWNRRAVLDVLSSGTRHEYEQVAFTPHYIKNTRRLAALDISLDDDALHVTLTPQATRFYMQGLGYTHPEWGHGCHHGAVRVGYDTLDPSQAEADLAAGQLHNLHIQQLVKAELHTKQGKQTGQGVIEQLFVGAHAPSGFDGLTDGIVA